MEDFLCEPSGHKLLSLGSKRAEIVASSLGVSGRDTQIVLKLPPFLLPSLPPFLSADLLEWRGGRQTVCEGSLMLL